MRKFFPIILVILAIGIFFLVINPQYKNYQAIVAQGQQVNDALSKVRQLQSTLDGLLSKENSISSSDMDRLQKMVPNNVDNIRLFLDLQGIASKYNIALQNIAVGDQSSQNANSQTIGPSNVSFGTITLSFGVTTSYENLLLFMNDIEHSLRIVEIQSMSFSADSSRTDQYKVSISIGTYWLKSDTSNSTPLTSQQL